MSDRPDPQDDPNPGGGAPGDGGEGSAPTSPPSLPSPQAEPTSPGALPTAEEGGERSGSPPSRGEAQPEVPAWAQKRINQLTAQLKAEKARNAQAGQASSAATPTPPSASGEPDPALVEARARELSAQQEFLRQCDELQTSGRSAFGQANFDARTNALRDLFDPTNPPEAQAWNSMLMAAHETGRGAELLFELGSDLGEAQRLMTLSPTKMMLELGKRAAKLEGQPLTPGLTSPTPLPNPIRPVGNRGPSHSPIAPDDPERAANLDMATWMARRNEQVKSRGLR